MKRSGPLHRDPAKQRDWQQRSRKSLRRSPLVRASNGRRNGRAISPASIEQRRKVVDCACLVCGKVGAHPAHLIDRSLGGDDDPRAVVPLCFEHHRAYDAGGLDLLPLLEPHFREEVAYAVQLVGVVRALERLTNQRWAACPRKEN